jgi:hypothetical protein
MNNFIYIPIEDTDNIQTGKWINLSEVRTIIETPSKMIVQFSEDYSIVIAGKVREILREKLNNS